MGFFGGEPGLEIVVVVGGWGGGEAMGVMRLCLVGMGCMAMCAVTLVISALQAP
jgi:hypothetical protein